MPELAIVEVFEDLPDPRRIAGQRFEIKPIPGETIALLWKGITGFTSSIK